MQAITPRRGLEGLHWEETLQNRTTYPSVRVSPMALPNHQKARKYNPTTSLEARGTRIFGKQH